MSNHTTEFVPTVELGLDQSGIHARCMSVFASLVDSDIAPDPAFVLGIAVGYAASSLEFEPNHNDFVLALRGYLTVEGRGDELRAMIAAELDARTGNLRQSRTTETAVAAA